MVYRVTYGERTAPDREIGPKQRPTVFRSGSRKGGEGGVERPVCKGYFTDFVSQMDFVERSLGLR